MFYNGYELYLKSVFANLKMFNEELYNIQLINYLIEKLEQNFILIEGSKNMWKNLDPVLCLKYVLSRKFQDYELDADYHSYMNIKSIYEKHMINRDSIIEIINSQKSMQTYFV